MKPQTPQGITTRSKEHQTYLHSNKKNYQKNFNKKRKNSSNSHSNPNYSIHYLRFADHLYSRSV